jgi:WD40 repeat protein
VAFNPVKDAELCSVSSDGVVKFWDVRTKAVINEVKGLGDAFTLAWNPDGESLVVGNKVCALSLEIFRRGEMLELTVSRPTISLYYLPHNRHRLLPISKLFKRTRWHSAGVERRSFSPLEKDA